MACQYPPVLFASPYPPQECDTDGSGLASMESLVASIGRQWHPGSGDVGLLCVYIIRSWEGVLLQCAMYFNYVLGDQQWPILETIMCNARDIIWRTVQVESSDFL